MTFIIFRSLITMMFFASLFIACQPDHKSSEKTTEINPDSDTMPGTDQGTIVRQEVLKTDDYSVHITTSGQSVLKTLALSVEDSSGQHAFLKEVVIDGIVMGSHLADLNDDGFQEVYIFNQSAGSGSYVQMIAYQIGQGRMDTILLEDLKEPVASMYMGHDSFSLEKKSLTRFFPRYHELDPNCCPTGGTHRIDYRLVRRGGSLMLVEQPTK